MGTNSGTIHPANTSGTYLPYLDIYLPDKNEEQEQRQHPGQSQSLLGI